LQRKEVQEEGKKMNLLFSFIKEHKRAAIEMSISTIIIIVIAVIMLIMGIVFVRGIMCNAIGLTGEIDNNVKGEINKLFSSTGGIEVQCIGSGEAIKMVPGKVNQVWCGIKAPQTASYTIQLTNYSGVYSTETEIKKWVVKDVWEGSVAPGDNLPKKVFAFNIPDNAPEETLFLTVAVKKDGNLISTQDLTYEISRVGFVQGAMC
jgi:hypothetical protein